MKKNKILSAALLAGTLSMLLIRGSYALYTDSISVTSHVKTGNVNIHIEEYEKDGGSEIVYRNPKTVMPGDVVSKIPKICNDAEDCWIRARVIFEPADDGPVLTEDAIGGIPDVWKHVGDYYYLTEPLPSGESKTFFEEIHIPEEWTERQEDRQFSVTIRADAVQMTHFTPDFDAASPWGDQSIDLCVREKDNYEIGKQSNIQFSVKLQGDAPKLVVMPEDFFSNFGRLMPGDSMTDRVLLHNTTKRKAELFFSAGYQDQTPEQVELLKALELTIEYKGKELYKGPLTGDDLNREISLGRYKAGEKGELVYTVRMPEELENAFALRDADVIWNFRVEQKEPSGGYSPGGGTSYGRDPVKTGDETHAEAAFVTVVLAMLLGPLCANRLHRRRRE
ncbi:MAG: hypothetical protein IJX90_05150 [Blautia sp.]|nr:hypothetical protein [Blautia sp.]